MALVGALCDARKRCERARPVLREFFLQRRRWMRPRPARAGAQAVKWHRSNNVSGAESCFSRETDREDMQKEIEAEGEKEEDLYNKFMCYCDGQPPEPRSRGAGVAWRFLCSSPGSESVLFFASLSSYFVAEVTLTACPRRRRTPARRLRSLRASSRRRRRRRASWTRSSSSPLFGIARSGRVWMWRGWLGRSMRAARRRSCPFQ